jgi:hypothetical protein
LKWLITLLTLTLWVSVTSAGIRAQDKAFPSKTRSAPRISGRLIGTQGTRQLIVEYNRDAGRGIFIGTVLSTCRVPAKVNAPETTPIELSGIPKGSQVTIFYIRRVWKHQGTERVENTILALRVDRLKGTFSVPVGKTIPCYESAPTPPAK